MEGLKESLPKSVREQLQIKVVPDIFRIQGHVLGSLKTIAILK